MCELKIFTPTYNRAKELKRLYESLNCQTNKNFEWLIIDDGSTDLTKLEVDLWKLESKINIQYFYKENGGKFSAYNFALDMVEEKLNVCIDSDNWLDIRFVEKILKLHEQYKEEKDVISYVLPRSTSGKISKIEKNKNIENKKIDGWIVTTDFPEAQETTRIFKPNALRGIRFTPFEGEKFQTEAVIYIQAAYRGKMLFHNEYLEFGVYLKDGLFNNYDKLLKENPKGVALNHRLLINYLKSH